MRFTPRLEQLLRAGIPGEAFWDFCCDHGYLGEAALRSGLFGPIHFVDQVPHIIHKIQARLEGAQFHIVNAEEIAGPIDGVAVLAGIGAFNMIRILKKWEERGVLSAKRLVLNPMSHEIELREFLESWPVYVEQETLWVHERGREREIIILVKPDADIISEKRDSDR